MLSKIQELDVMEDTMQIQTANKVQGKNEKGDMIT